MGSMRKSLLSRYKQDRLTEHFVWGLAARTAAGLCGGNRKTAAFCFLRLRGYNALDVSDFHHFRINHSKLFADEHNHINGIENFWNQAKATCADLTVFLRRTLGHS